MKLVKSTKTKQTEPRSILDPRFNYIPAAKTDIKETWKKYGWTPPSEKRT